MTRWLEQGWEGSSRATRTGGAGESSRVTLAGFDDRAHQAVSHMLHGLARFQRPVATGGTCNMQTAYRARVGTRAGVGQFVRNANGVRIGRIATRDIGWLVRRSCPSSCQPRASTAQRPAEGSVCCKPATCRQLLQGARLEQGGAGSSRNANGGAYTRVTLAEVCY
jgi:hypothetical protein